MNISGCLKHQIGGLIAPSYVKSQNQAQLNSLQNILVKCDITTGSYSNSQLSNIICAVTPNVSPYSTIIYTPVHPVRCPINTTRIESMMFTLTDQDGDDIDIGSDTGTQSPELWSVYLTIKPIEMAGLL